MFSVFIAVMLSLVVFSMFISVVLSLLAFSMFISVVLSLLAFSMLISVVLLLLVFSMFISMALPLLVFSVHLFPCLLKLSKLISRLIEDIAQLAGNSAVSVWPVLHWRPACGGGFNNSTSIFAINFLFGHQLTDELAQGIRSSLSRYLG